MKNVTLIYSLLGLILLTPATKAAVQNKHELTIHAGGLLFEGNSDTQDPILWGFRYGRHLSTKLSIEGSLFSGRDELKNNAGRYSLMVPTLHGVYHLSNQTLSPFIQVGVGVLRVIPENQPDWTHASSQLGGGLKWRLSENFTARWDLAYLVDLEQSRGQNNVLSSLGIGWRFDNPFYCTPCKKQEEEEKKVEPKDSDQDGVIDELDECPDTSSGTLVNEKGCPQEAQIKKEETFTLTDVRFAFNSAKLNTQGRLHMEAMTAIFKSRPQLMIDIHGHTDNRGPKSYNQLLSEKRAQAAKEYLLEKGIEAGRITTRGFGLTQPVASNQTIEGRAANRRIEFKVTQP